jgi:hypothetical protein
LINEQEYYCALEIDGAPDAESIEVFSVADAGQTRLQAFLQADQRTAQ